MRIVIALGGNALLRRGEAMTATNQRENIKIAASALAPIAEKHELIITHGNGPQIGLLALQSAAYKDVESYPLDVLDAQTEGMIGYMIEQEMGNILPDRHYATLLTMVEVDKNDPAFTSPTKPIGPIYTKEEADTLAEKNNWCIAPDGDAYRRVVPSPKPKKIFETKPIEWLLEKKSIVICAGGGGIPTLYNDENKLEGVEAVIDKDRASAMLAQQINADFYIMATDVDAVYINWKQPEQHAIQSAAPESLEKYTFTTGSMAPKVEAACTFAKATGKTAAIGALKDIEHILDGKVGTLVNSHEKGIIFHENN